MQPSLILASTSTYRQSLLQRLGIPFRCVAPEVDESFDKSEGTDPARLATTLARRKCMAVAAQFDNSVVIGSDQVCAFGERILSKPGNPSSARRQLQELSGRTHMLHTAVCVAAAATTQEFLVSTRLRMRDLSPDEIARYVDRDAPEQCAGSYRIESGGIALFRDIECDDFTAIVGLPLMQLSDVLRRFGVPVP